MSKFSIKGVLIISICGTTALSTAATSDQTFTEDGDVAIATPEAQLGDEATAALVMNFFTTPIGDLYDYEFELVFTNDDGSWKPGHGYGWIIFGDKKSGTSPLNFFLGDKDDLPIGPWEEYGVTLGDHNGPNLADVFYQWYPTTVGQTLNWSGTHERNRTELTFSSILTSGGAPTINWQPMGDPGPTLEQFGDCPGLVTLEVSNVAPGGNVAFVYSTSSGSFTIPNGYGTCPGAELPLGGTPKLLAVVRANVNGVASFTGTAQSQYCDLVRVAGLDLDSCIATGSLVLR